ncbi:MAG: M20/M25/M40 family metallo-hydrolase [Thermodesulfobacteriota bacterium]
MMRIDSERLAQLFVTMCEIDSPSGQEARMAHFLKALFGREFPEATIEEDDSAPKTGADCGNLIIRFAGQLPGTPIFFNCHTDTVVPSLGVKVRREGRRFFSSGDTVLGGDDKAGIAILIEAVRAIREAGLPHLPFELLFTTSEEIGLRGAKALDVSLLRARQGYALDSTGVDLAILGAPAANHFTIAVHGVAAHAGLHPERGINAIQLLSRCIADLPTGRLDEESTSNLGVIRGGKATNIVPEFAEVDGEVRSHSMEKLAVHTRRIEERVKSVISAWQPPAGADLPEGTRPRLEFRCNQEYPAMRLTQEDEVVRRVLRAGERLGRTIRCISAGGGSDANILNGHGIATVILGIGMDKVHSTEETIDLADMIRTTELVASMLTT